MNAVAFIDEFIASYKPFPKDLVASIVKSCQEKIKGVSMKEYIVKYTWHKNPDETYMFLCTAENVEDAIQQCLKDYSDCEVVSVDEKDF